MNIAGTFFGSKTEVVEKVKEVVEKGSAVAGKDNGHFFRYKRGFLLKKIYY